MTIGPAPLCFECKHYTGETFNEPELRTDYFCDAFPNGIPFDIISGGYGHTTPFEGDNGIQYEAASPDDEQE
jgi:hypothetical protein